MIITYTNTVDTLRGVSGGRKYSTMGAAMRANGSQVFKRQTLRRSRFTPAETRGKETINTLVHDFADLSNDNRYQWDYYRKKIRWEWQTRVACGPEQTHPKCITFSELDFFVACNHHLVLSGGTSVKTPTVCLHRPWIEITGVSINEDIPGSYNIEIDTNLQVPQEITVWIECTPPRLSAGVRPADNMYYAASETPSQCYRTVISGQTSIIIDNVRYDPVAGDNWHVRLLKHNKGLAPYGYSYWSGIVRPPLPPG